MQEAAEACELALEGLEAATGAVSQGAMQAVIDARRRFVAASAAAAAKQELRHRRFVALERERPSPSMTKILARPAMAKYIGALRTAAGGLESAGKQMARMVAAFFAGVSASRPRVESAEERVLGAVRTHATQLDAGAAERAGKAEVSAEEVKEVVRWVKPGTAPGPDGLPPEVWRRGGQPMWGLLASLYTAVGRTGTAPRGFLAGVVTPIFKAGDAAAMANYRPITLLNTDYRLMTKGRCWRGPLGLSRQRSCRGAPSPPTSPSCSCSRRC